MCVYQVELILTLGKIATLFHWKVYFSAITRQTVSLLGSLSNKVLCWIICDMILVEQKDHAFEFSIYLTKIPKLANMTAYQTLEI